MPALKPQASYDDFARLDIRIGKVVDVQPFPRARNPSYKVGVEIGADRIMWSSAQITNYAPAALLGSLGLQEPFSNPSWFLFPTAIRASASGFAAACAKVGATFGTFLVPQLQETWGLTGVLALMAFVSVGGLVTTAAFAYSVDKEDELEESETVKGAHQPA